MFNKENVKKQIRQGLTTSITEVFQRLDEEISNVIEKMGEKRKDYNLHIHPFSLSRVDGEKVPSRVLKAIQKHLEKTI